MVFNAKQTRYGCLRAMETGTRWHGGGMETEARYCVIKDETWW